MSPSTRSSVQQEQCLWQQNRKLQQEQQCAQKQNEKRTSFEKRMQKPVTAMKTSGEAGAEKEEQAEERFRLQADEYLLDTISIAVAVDVLIGRPDMAGCWPDRKTNSFRVNTL